MTDESLKPSETAVVAGETAVVARETAVVVIDMLNDFVTGALKCDRAQMIIPKIKALVEAARTAGAHVVYSNDAHSAQDHELKVAWDAHAMAGTKGAQVIAELAPVGGDHVSPKTTYSAFFDTDLDEFLKSKGITTLVLTGLHTDCCVRHTAADAFFRGYRVVVPDDCVQAFTEEAHTAGLEYLKFWYKAETPSTAELVGALRKEEEE